MKNISLRLRVSAVKGFSPRASVNDSASRSKGMVVMSMQKNSATVYSTEHGRICPGCGKPATGCSCSKKKNAPRGDGIVRVGRETKGRKGKGVTVIIGVPLDDDGLLELAKQLKQKCGTGGTVKDGVIEIQGDQRETLVDLLTKQGFKVKTIGG